jgi:hypothetical protein
MVRLIMNPSPVEPRPSEYSGEVNIPPGNESVSSYYLELYKLAVEMADRISSRRGIANSFFLTLNTGVMALLGAQHVRWYVAAAGIAACISWWILLRSYRELNQAKFNVIIAMEDKLPVRIYGEEWSNLGNKSRKSARRRPWTGQYRGLGYIEQLVPPAFIVVYLAALVSSAT